MSSIVIDLQNEITSSDCDVVNILRRAYIIAVKLGLKEFDQWISCELNGYHKQDFDSAFVNHYKFMESIR